MITFANNQAIQAVIFDFDGVIVDTEPIHYQAFQDVLAQYNIGFSWDEYVNIYMGFDDRDAFIECYKNKKKELGKEHLSNLIAQKAVSFQSIIQNGVNAYPGVIDLINELHKSKIPMAICSGALKSDINPILEQFKIKDFFKIIVTAEDVTKSKPDPESYKITFEKLIQIYDQNIISKEYTAVIVDTPAGIQSALQNGLKIIAVTNSYPTSAFSNKHTVISTLDSLLPLKGSVI